MCLEHEGDPTVVYVIPKNSGSQLPVPVLVNGKVTRLTNGVHRTNLEYPLGQIVNDPKAIVGSHDMCIHLLASPSVAQYTDVSSFGSHVLAVTPTHQLWTRKGPNGRCFHADAVLPLLCLTCEGIAANDLANSDLQREFEFDRMNLSPAVAAFRKIAKQSRLLHSPTTRLCDATMGLRPRVSPSRVLLDMAEDLKPAAPIPAFGGGIDHVA